MPNKIKWSVLIGLVGGIFMFLCLNNLMVTEPLELNKSVPISIAMSLYAFFVCFVAPIRVG